MENGVCHFSFCLSVCLSVCLPADRPAHCFLCVQSKAVRESWLLDGAPSAGPEQDGVKKQQDEAKTRDLEETIIRSDQH